MKISFNSAKQDERGNMILYAFFMTAVLLTAVVLGSLVSQTTMVTNRRTNLIQANQYAEAGAVIGCADLNSAITTNVSGTIATHLTSLLNYAKNDALSVSGTNVYQRTIAAPFSGGQTVLAQIRLPTVSSPQNAKIVATATVGSVTQTAKVNMVFSWSFPGAIVSVNQGTSETANSKNVAKDGNVTVNGGSSGPLVINGGSSGLAVLANGRINYDTNYLNPPKSAYSMTNWGTANQITDFTSQGTSNTLFDLNRFIAVANATTNGYSPSHNNHFTNFSTFITAANTYNNPSNNAMQGVIVVDVASGDPGLKNGLDIGTIPNGINIKGTLLFNFVGSGWDPASASFKLTAALNVNAANLNGVVATNPATYTTGYPPVYTDPTKNPVNIDITGQVDPATGVKDFQNFQNGDDLPAMLYSEGVPDLHGPVDVCGLFYTPCYIELENKADGQFQYINGSVLCGGGIYYENTSASTSIITYDAKAVDSLTTIGSEGKSVFVTYWEP